MFNILDWLAAMCSYVMEMLGEKIVLLFLSAFPYVMVALVFQRIQYPAMIGENLESEKPLITKTSL